MKKDLPVAIIGAGPVGLAAAAHLASRDQPFLLVEQGASAGHAVHQWAHVRLFSPWRYNIDRAAERLLAADGWTPPPGEEIPTGSELLDRYILPLARHPALAPHLLVGARVLSVGRADMDKVQSRGRGERPFELRLADGGRVEARAVIDASGTWFSPNPASARGYAGEGEIGNAGRIAYGIPDLLGSARRRYAGKRVLVLGSGHSAIHGILDLAALAESDAGTRTFWAIRRDNTAGLFGGGGSDSLPARGALGMKARALLEAGKVEMLAPFLVRDIVTAGRSVEVQGELKGAEFRLPVDEIIVAAGFRPDLSMLREVRLGLDPWLEAPERLAPLIDPNEHGCETVPPHGFAELRHPEGDFHIAGMKSYGRAPTFLMTTGYEQVRSIAAALAGDLEAAGRVELELPAAGVCRGGSRDGLGQGGRQEGGASSPEGCSPSAGIRPEQACCS